MKVFSGFNAKEISKNKVFEIKDVFVYALLAIIILALFLSFTLFNKNNALGFTVSVGGTVILTHVYGENDFKKHGDWENKIVVTKNGTDYLVEILTDNGGSNLIYSNEKAKTVEVVESNCPSKNCTHMSAISTAGTIYCAPRDIKILPLSDSGDLPPVTGGVG